MNERSRIIQGIIHSGGLYGQIASCIQPTDEDNFIIECFEQCHNKEANDLWGKELVMDIINYRLGLIRIPLKKLLEQKKYECAYVKNTQKA